MIAGIPGRKEADTAGQRRRAVINPTGALVRIRAR